MVASMPWRSVLDDDDDETQLKASDQDQEASELDQAASVATTKASDRIPSPTPGAEPPRDARDSGSARSHSTHLETSSSNRP